MKFFTAGTDSRTQVRYAAAMTCCFSATVATRLVDLCRNWRLCHLGMDSDTELRPTDKEMSCEFPGLERRVPPFQNVFFVFVL